MKVNSQDCKFTQIIAKKHRQKPKPLYQLNFSVFMLYDFIISPFYRIQDEIPYFCFMTLLIRRTTCALMLLLTGTTSFSQDTLRIMSYNILNYSGSSGVVTRYNDMKTVIDYVLPDIMICNELIDANGAALLLNNAFNTSGRTNYARANFVDGPDTDNMLFYNTDKLTLQSQAQISTVLRDVSHYRLYYTDGADTAWINILSGHLKAGNSASEASQRLTEVSAVCSAIAGVSPNEAFIFGGDLE
jgi:hypothetical protein